MSSGVYHYCHLLTEMATATSSFAVQHIFRRLSLLPSIDGNGDSNFKLCGTYDRRLLEEAWLRVGAIIAEFNISGYGVAR